MAGTLQPLDQKFPIANPDGTPTDYFTRWAQQKQDDIVAAATADQVSTAIDDWAAARLINTASPILGGGSLANDLNLSHAASGVAAGTYGDATNVAQITVDAEGHITTVVNVAITGGGGGGTAWSSITGTPTTLAGYGITDAAPLSHVGAGGAAHALVVAAGAAGFMSGADKTKLDGIAAGATANSTDAFLLARANHTGTQGVGTITGLGYFATGTDAANLTGTVAAARLPAMAGGDVTSAIGTVKLTIGANKVTRGMLAQAAGATLLGATAAGNVADLTAAQAKTFLAIVEGDVANLTTDLAAKAPLASPEFTGVAYYQQPSPTAKNSTTTLTIADLQTLIITSTSTTAVSLTLPTGTLTDAGILGGALIVNEAFEWYLINLGSSSGAVTLVAGVGHTIVGSAVVAIGTSARFLTRKTATNTFVTYRIA